MGTWLYEYFSSFYQHKLLNNVYANKMWNTKSQFKIIIIP